MPVIKYHFRKTQRTDLEKSKKSVSFVKMSYFLPFMHNKNFPPKMGWSPLCLLNLCECFLWKVVLQTDKAELMGPFRRAGPKMNL